MAGFKGIVFGPGFADAGTAVDFEADADGIRLAAGDHAPRWSAITVGKAGWDGTRLGLEWEGASGRYALTVAGAAAVQALGALAGRRAVRSAGTGGGTHAWVWGIVGVTLLLPLLLLLALLLAHEQIADWIVDRIPVTQEQKLGAQLFNSHKPGLKLVEGAPLAMVRETGARLTQGSRYKFEFYVVDDKTVNAYAMPGGYIVMHSGLLALAGSADEVAGVLAHEVAHVERRHSLRGMIKSAGLYATASLVFGDFGSLAGVGADLLNLKFSRDNERDADSTGLTLLVKAGLEPSAMASFFRKMAAQGGGVPAFLSTHPASEDRFADIERAVKALPEAARAAPPLAVDYAVIKAALPVK
jgi:Zn-dependent protease with chaperone function